MSAQGVTETLLGVLQTTAILPESQGPPRLSPSLTYAQCA